MADEPVVWDAAQRRFVPAARSTPPSGGADNSPGEAHGAPRHVVVTPPGTPASIAPRPAARAAAPVIAPSPPPRGRGPARPAVPAPPGRGARTSRRRWVKVAVAALILVALVPVAMFFFGWWQFSRISTVNVGKVLSASTPGGTNYLIVGTDTRDGIKAGDPNAGAFLGGESPTGSRTDTIMVLRVEGSKTALLSIPRDLWVKNPKTGEMGRINATFASGPDVLIQSVQSLGIPVQHYMEINFVSFAKLVDAVGGITIDFPNPARDTHSGLAVEKSGKVRLDGTQALAYVRSRYYEELVDGTWRTDPTADLGRVQRQRAFLKALFSTITGTRNPLTLIDTAGALGGGLRIDNKLTYFEALGLAWHLRGFDPESLTLPVTPRTTSGGAAVLDLKKAEAAPLLQRFSS